MRVLVLDDQPEVIRLVERVVDHLGHGVVTAQSAEAARRLADQDPGPFDLLLVDRHLDGGIDGATLASELRGALGDPAVLLMSGEPTQVPGVDGFLQKPFAIADLRDALERFA